MARVPADRLDTLGHFRDILDALATGGIDPSGGYERLQRTLLSDQDLAPLLPEWLVNTRTTDEFRLVLHGHPGDPLGFIREAMEPALTYLESREFNLDDQPKVHPLFRPVTRRRPSRPVVEPTAEKATARIFIVHGHDISRREAVARFVEKLGFHAVVLADEPDQGRTIIEKFEDHSGVNFAIVLMTPDDFGGARGLDPRPRARQNVILEQGFFIGLLGRDRVVALVVGDIEEPSDVSGVLYDPWDEGGAWKGRLADEMKAVGLPVNKNRL
jgi:predicted nucleotide-binding protein